jgi:predicted DNA-binding ribbon-helix-helix protein
MKSAVIRRHIRITLEDAFWSGLKEIAQAQGASVAQTVKEIDGARRPGSNLSSAIRVFVLDRLRSKSGGHRTGSGSPLISADSFGGDGDGY